MKAEEYINSHSSTVRTGMAEYERVVSHRDALQAVRMAREEIIGKFEKELASCNFAASPKQSKQSLNDLIRFLKDE